MFFFSWGLANLTSVANLYVRDYAPLQSLILQGLFYATPIIYDAQMLADKGYPIVYEINPFYYMLEVVRKPMLGQALPDAKTYAIAITLTAVTFFFGVLVQLKAKKEVAYML